MHWLFLKKQEHINAHWEGLGPKPLASVKLREMQTAFPGQSEPAIRKRFKLCADFQRGGDASWVLKSNFKLPTEEEIRKKTTPEEIVLYQCMQSGYQRLHDYGIDSQLYHPLPPQISSSFEDHPKGRVMKAIEEELLLTPWNLTSNFVQATQATNSSEGNCVLQLTGFGDPSGRGEAFSFLRVPMKKNAAETEEAESNVNDDGIKSDLRKLSKEDAGLILMGFGVSEIPAKRWDRITMIRNLSSEAKQTGEEDQSVTQFARSAKATVQTMQQQINTKLETIFMNQRKALEKDSDPSDDDFYWSDEDDEELFGDLEKEIGIAVAKEEKEKLVKRKTVVASSKKAFDPEDPEKRLYQNFMMETQSERPNAVQQTSRLVHIEGELLPNGLIKKTLAPTQQKFYLKRTKIVETLEGPREVVDFVTDPDQVQQILEKRRRLTRIGGNKTTIYSMGEEEDQKRLALKKEKRKMQEKQRRSKKNIALRKELQERYKQGSRDGQLPNGNVTLQCGRCGMHGHMKTNKSCPVYFGDEEEDGKSEQVLPQVPSILLSRGGARASRVKRESATTNKRKRGREDEYEEDFLDDDDEIDEYYL